MLPLSCSALGNDNGCGQDGTSSACTLRAETTRIAKCRAPVDPPEHAPVSRSRRLRNSNRHCPVARLTPLSLRQTPLRYTASSPLRTPSAIHLLDPRVSQLPSARFCRYPHLPPTIPVVSLFSVWTYLENTHPQTLRCIATVGSRQAVITVFVRLRFVRLRQSGSSGCPAFRSSRWTQEAEGSPRSVSRSAVLCTSSRVPVVPLCDSGR